MATVNKVTLSSPVEVFYSYSHKDETLRDELEKHLSILRRQGVISGWHDRKIGAGQEWAGEIDAHINSAQIILLLISSDFLASDYCYDKEMLRAMERHDSGEAVVIPVILRDADWSGAPFGKVQSLPTDVKAITSWSNRDEAFKDVAVGIRKAVERISTALPGSRGVVSKVKTPTLTAKNAVSMGHPSQHPTKHDGGLPGICNLPHLRNPNFTGRDELLKLVHDALTSGKAAALTQAMVGLGGVGKTQTAVEYIYRHAGEYEIAWWIRSEEPAKLASDFAALAEPLQLPERSAQDQGVIAQAVRHALAERGRWLIVFDNANGPNEIREYLPQGGTGHVLVTSRYQAFSAVARPLKVEKMTAEESVDFLVKRSQQSDRSAAAALAKELGYLPLALEHAGAYIEKNGSSFSKYLELFKTRQHDILERAEHPDGYNATVATTWEISFREVEKESAAGQLVNLCAFLAPDDIAREMLRSGAEYLSEPLKTTVADDLLWNDAVGALRKYSLMEAQDGTLSVHRLVQAVVRERLGEAGQKKWAEAAVKVVDDAFPYDSDDVWTWPVCARLLPHALLSAEHAENLRVGLENGSRLLNQVGLYLTGRAEFVTARSALERALEIDEAIYGPDHPDVAIDVNNLGCVLRELGDFAGAQERFERALRIGEATYGPDHTQVAIYANNLGLALKTLGDFAGARKHFERALKINETAYGPDHPTVAIRINNLGKVLQDLGDLAGARKHFERALKIDEATYGSDHPTVAILVNNLGLVLEDLGDLAGARKHYERALKIFERVLGTDHPKTQLVRRNLESLGKGLRGKAGSSLRSE